ncbi:MAG TPA: glycosyltransferase family 39 protein [Aggregatilineaceae bacterium]|nr:glycosyltransferase family 39 protein [Aggregatilineaceae bacterium]
MSKASVPFWICTLAIVFLAGFIRFHALDTYPILFNQDEMELGYDAWSIWQTGRDQHDELLPLFFRSFDDYVSPVAHYVTAPFVGLLGLSEFSTRLPAAVLGVATVFLVALLGREWFSPAAGVVAALLMAVEPWPVNYSRIAFPASLVPFFTTAALFTFSRAMSALRGDTGRRRQRIAWLMGCALAFALLTATYPTMKLQAPLLLLICVVAAGPLLWQHRWTTLYWLIFFVICINPYFTQQIFRWNTVQARFDQVALTATGPGTSPVSQALVLYLSHFDPRLVFFDGFGGGLSVRPAGIGELTWLEIPLLLIGVIGLIRFKPARRLGFNLPPLLALWCLAFPIADSLTTGHYGLAHEIRFCSVFPLPELVAGYGALVLWRVLIAYRRPLAYLAAAAGGVVLVIFSARFLDYAFNPAQLAAPKEDMPYNVGLGPMLDVTVKVEKACDMVWIEPFYQPYIYYLFLSKYPPPKFQELSRTQIAANALNTIGVDHVRFEAPPADPPPPAGCETQSHFLYWITRQTAGVPGWVPIATYRNAAGQPLWTVLTREARPDYEF